MGLKVKRLIRSRIGPLTPDGLQPGQNRVLTQDDLQFVYDAQSLYRANQEAWDAEMPEERQRRRWWKKKPEGGSGTSRTARPGGARPPARRPDDVRVREAGPSKPGEEPARRRRYYS